MKDTRLLDELGARISEVLANSPVRDFEKNLKALFAATFDRFDLVTREDFEAQRRVLERTRAQLAALEARLAELESGRTRG
ncbi:MAG: accessory factor UbiK family protein [Betaproteobacteria bacterium]|nr:accessory factor UbiK family protein [Betaproteobacteria bacterium]